MPSISPAIAPLGKATIGRTDRSGKKTTVALPLYEASSSDPIVTFAYEQERFVNVACTSSISFGVTPPTSSPPIAGRIATTNQDTG